MYRIAAFAAILSAALGNQRSARGSRTEQALRAIQALRDHGLPVDDALLIQLPPLGWEHINLLGRYAFSVPEDVRRGELRPLRDPAAAAENR